MFVGLIGFGIWVGGGGKNRVLERGSEGEIDNSGGGGGPFFWADLWGGGELLRGACSLSFEKHGGPKLGIRVAIPVYSSFWFLDFSESRLFVLLPITTGLFCKFLGNF